MTVGASGAVRLSPSIVIQAWSQGHTAVVTVATAVVSTVRRHSTQVTAVGTWSQCTERHFGQRPWRAFLGAAAVTVLLCMTMC